jgi:hypothetical protein
MPLTWKRGTNPYRVNAFSILQIGPNARRGIVVAARKRVAARIELGAGASIDGRPLTTAEVYEAESRLLDERGWAAEVMLVHPAPTTDPRRLAREVSEAATPTRTARRLQLANPAALAPFVPVPGVEDVGWPGWDELGVLPAGCESDRDLDVQFDL